MPSYRTVRRIKFRNGNDRAFHDDVRRRAAKWFASSGRPRTATPEIYTKALMFAGFAVTAYAALLSGHPGPLAALGLAVACQVSLLFLVLNMSHDAAHHALTGSRRADDLIHTCLFNLLGVNGYLWQLRHVKSHHVFPNVDGCDADIDHNGLIRLSPEKPRRWWHRWQHLYALPAYALVAVHSILVQDTIYLFKRQLANLCDIRHGAGQIIGFFLGKAAFVALAFVAPALVTDYALWQIALGYLVAAAVASLVFILPLIPTHFTDMAAFGHVSDDGRLADSFAVHAMRSSLDWAPQNRFWTWLYGGLNCHAAHHLFPDVSHAHYRTLSRLIARSAKAHGVPYNRTDLIGAIASHFRFLYRMGRQDHPRFGTQAAMAT